MCKLLTCVNWLSTLFLIFVASGANAQEFRSCQAHYQAVRDGQLVAKWGGGSPLSIVDQEFRVRRECSNVGPNRCRVNASNDAHDCMKSHFDAREPDGIFGGQGVDDRPPACKKSVVLGYSVTSFRDSVGIAVCRDTNAPAARLLVQLSRKTHGQTGCSGGLTGNTKSRALGDYTVDCPFYIARFDLDNTPETRHDNIDRPGGDMAAVPQGGIPVTQEVGCKNLCELSQNCRAWTFVKATNRCFVKDEVTIGRVSDCCVSGTKFFQKP